MELEGENPVFFSYQGRGSCILMIVILVCWVAGGLVGLQWYFLPDLMPEQVSVLILRILVVVAGAATALLGVLGLVAELRSGEVLVKVFHRYDARADGQVDKVYRWTPCKRSTEPAKYSWQVFKNLLRVVWYVGLHALVYYLLGMEIGP